MVAFSNGTAALHGAAFAAGLGPGDEILTSPLSFAASSNCALYLGARPRFVDISPETWNLDPAALEARLGARTRAVVAVSFAGLPVDLEPLASVRKQVVLIEDAAHALGALRSGRRVGGAGGADMTVFSFHPVKAMTTGEGGAVATEDAELARRLRLFRTHGITKEGTSPSPNEGDWYYEMQMLGFNYRITDFQCALGLSQLRHLDGWVERRNAIARHYRELLAGEDRIALPPAAPGGSLHAYHLFVVKVRAGAEARLAAFQALRGVGIGVQVHYIPIYRQPYYRDVLAYPQAECPAAGGLLLGSDFVADVPGNDRERRGTSRGRGEEGAPVKSETRNLTESARWLERARRVVPACSNTLSKNPTQWVQGVAPTFVVRAKGAHVWDVDGNRYVDFPMALGPVILGHADPAVEEAIVRQLRDGIVVHAVASARGRGRRADHRRLSRAPERAASRKTGSTSQRRRARLARAYTGPRRVLVAATTAGTTGTSGRPPAARGTGVVRSLVQGSRSHDLDAARGGLRRASGGVACVVLRALSASSPTGVARGVSSAPTPAARWPSSTRSSPASASLRRGGGTLRGGADLGSSARPSAMACRSPRSTGRAEIDGSACARSSSPGRTVARPCPWPRQRRRWTVLAREPVHAHLKGEFGGSAGDRRGIELQAWGRVEIAGARPGRSSRPRTRRSGPRLPAESLLQQELLERGVLFNGSNFMCLAHSAPTSIRDRPYGAAFEVLAGGAGGRPEHEARGSTGSAAFRPPR